MAPFIFISTKIQLITSPNVNKPKSTKAPNKQ